MHLIDTNVWLELLLEQEQAGEVRRLLETIDPTMFHITEFSIYSIAIILVRLKKIELFRRFVGDTFMEPGVNLIRPAPRDMETVLRAVERFNLDFDDAYQYAAAEMFGLQIVSLDDDFDRTERGRRTPREIVA